MAKETTKTTVRSACEEYVVEELKQAKKEISCLSNECFGLRTQLSDLKEAVKTLSNFIDVVDESEPYFNLYVMGNYITSIWKENKKYSSAENEFYKAINKIKTMINEEEKTFSKVLKELKGE